MTAIVEPQEQSRNKYLKAARTQWFDWRRSKLEPTWERAIQVVEVELGQSKEFERLSKPNKDGSLNDSLSFIYWDITENGRGALKYDEHDSFVRNLFEQARQIIAGPYALGSATVGEHRYKFSDVRKTNEGYQQIADMPREKLEDCIASFIEYCKEQILKWKRLGADMTTVRKTLMRALKEVRAEWSKTTKAA